MLYLHTTRRTVLSVIRQVARQRSSVHCGVKRCEESVVKCRVICEKHRVDVSMKKLKGADLKAMAEEIRTCQGCQEAMAWLCRHVVDALEKSKEGAQLYSQAPKRKADEISSNHPDEVAGSSDDRPRKKNLRLKLTHKAAEAPPRLEAGGDDEFVPGGDHDDCSEYEETSKRTATKKKTTSKKGGKAASKKQDDKKSTGKKSAGKKSAGKKSATDEPAGKKSTGLLRAACVGTHYARTYANTAAPAFTSPSQASASKRKQHMRASLPPPSAKFGSYELAPQKPMNGDTENKTIGDFVTA